MGPFELFVIRLMLSVLFAFFACRIFFGKTPLIKVAGLAGLMLGLAYLFEYMRKRNKGGDNGG